MNSQLTLGPGLMALLGSRIEACSHAHSAVQIVWPAAGEPWVINGETGEGAVVVGSNAPHSLSLAAGWVILLEPQSNPGQQAQRLQCGRAWCALPSLRDFQAHAPAQSDHPLLPVWRALRTART